jgi:hypothetical protein
MNNIWPFPLKITKDFTVRKNFNKYKIFLDTMKNNDAEISERFKAYNDALKHHHLDVLHHVEKSKESSVGPFVEDMRMSEIRALGKELTMGYKAA